MGGKSKKAKPALPSEAAPPEALKLDVDVKSIYKRLRKGAGIGLEGLRQEAERLDQISPSALTCLCLAKVELCLVINQMKHKSFLVADMLNAKSAPASISFEELRQEISAIADRSRNGAERYNSVLCGRLWFKLSLIITRKVDPIKMPTKPEDLLDLKSELVEDSTPWEFEKVDRKIDMRQVTVTWRVEIATIDKHLGKALHASNSEQLVSSLLQAGLLPPAQKNILETILASRQKHNDLHQILSHQPSSGQQLVLTDGNGRDAADEIEPPAKRKPDEVRKRAGKPADAEPAVDTSKEVLAYLTAYMDQLQDNEACFTAMQELSLIPMDNILKAFEMDSEAFLGFETDKVRALKLLPMSDAVVTSVTVEVRDGGKQLLRYPAVLNNSKQYAIDNATEDVRCRRAYDSGLDPERIAEQAFSSWGTWPGQLPSSLKPLEDAAELEASLQSCPDLVPLNEPTATFCEAVAASLKHQFDMKGVELRTSIIGSVVKTQLRRLLAASVTSKAPSRPEFGNLGNLTGECLKQMMYAAYEPSAMVSLETLLSDISSSIGSMSLWQDCNISEVGTILDKDLEEIVRKKGQLVVKLAEVHSKPTEIADVAVLCRTFDGIMHMSSNSQPIECRLETRLEGREVFETEHYDRFSNRKAVVEESNGAANGFDPETGVAWWDDAKRRFSDAQMRAAALDEVGLALQVLIDNGQFTTGVAMAVCAHIQSTLFQTRLGPDDILSSNANVYLEHIQLFSFQPLQELLHFLWGQLGLRANFLPLVDQVRQRLRQPDVHLGWHEIFADGTVRYSAGYMQDIWKGVIVPPLPGDAKPTTQAEQEPEASKPLSDEFLRKACQQPIINEPMLKSLVKQMFSLGPDPEETLCNLPSCHLDPEEELHQCQKEGQDQALATRDCLVQVMELVGELVGGCAQLVETMDAASDRPQLPLVVDQSSIEKVHLCETQPLLARQAVQAYEGRQKAEQLQYGIRVNTNSQKARGLDQQKHRISKLREGTAGHHSMLIEHMGAVKAEQVWDLLRGPGLFDERLSKVQEACDPLEKELQSMQGSNDAHSDKDRALQRQAHADARMSKAPGNINGFCGHNSGMLSSFLVEERNRLRGLLSAAASHLVSLQLQMDILAMQIQYRSRTSAEARCHNLGQLLLMGHNSCVSKKLLQEAREHHERSRTEAADKMAKELMKEDADKKTEAPAASKKAKKKKKAAAKLREEKLEANEEHNLQEPAPEDSAEEVSSFADIGGGPRELQEEGHSDLRLSATDMSGLDDYQKQLRDAEEEENWQQASKRKPRAGLKTADSASDSAFADRPASASGQPLVDADGWQISPERSQQHAEDANQNQRKGKAAAQQAESGLDSTAAPNAIPAAASSVRSGWDSSDDASSVTESHGDLPPGLPSPSRPSQSAPGTQGDAGQHSMQSPKQGSPAGKAASADSVQCNKCGKYGHDARDCQTAWCDFCNKEGHRTGDCSQFKSRPRDAPSKKPDPGQDQVSARQPSGRNSKQTCFYCHETGHIKAACPHRHQSLRSAGPPPPPPPRQAQGSAPASSQPPVAAASGSDAQQAASEAGRNGRGRDSKSRVAVVVRHKPRQDGTSVPTYVGSGPPPTSSADYPSLSAGPPGLPQPAGQQPAHSSQPSMGAWGQPGKGSLSQASTRLNSAAEPLTGHLQQSAQLQSSSEYQDPSSTSSYFRSQSQGSTEAFRREATTNGGFAQPDVQAAGRGPFDQEQPGAWGNQGFGHPALPHGLVQPGSQAAQNGWYQRPHPQDMGSDMLSAHTDPVVSLAFPHARAPVGPSHQQPGFYPAAPLAAFANAEAAHHTLLDEDAGTDDFMRGLMQDNLEYGEGQGYAAQVGSNNAAWPQVAATPHQGHTAWGNPDNMDYGLAHNQDEAEDMERAMQASIQDDDGQRAQVAAYEFLNSQAGASSSNAEVGTSTGTGLQNEAGEYNCFLNVIIQCLWHCNAFRKQVMKWDVAVYQDDPVVAALMGLFQALAQREALAHTDAQQIEGALVPTPLRDALSSAFSNVSSGEMHDAGEVLGMLYGCLTKVATRNGEPAMLERIFGLQVQEAVYCLECKKVSHALKYTQKFFNVVAPSLAAVHTMLGSPNLGELLKYIEEQTQKSCDKDNRGCGKLHPVTHTLLGTAPKVFTMQLTWPSANEPKEEIAGTLKGLKEVLDLQHVYSKAASNQYWLRSMVCYYGQHYMAVVLMPDRIWYRFDDATVVRWGEWADVVKKCINGRIQPSVIFYESAASS